MKNLYYKYYPTAAIILCAIIIWCFFQFWYPYHFFFQEQNQIFLWSWDYISTYTDKSGGLAGLVGDFLTQFYYYLFAGATILTACLLIIECLLYKALTNFKVSKPVALLLALFVMVFVGVCHFHSVQSVILEGFLWELVEEDVDGADAVEVDAQDMADVFVGLALFRCRF